MERGKKKITKEMISADNVVNSAQASADVVAAKSKKAVGLAKEIAQLLGKEIKSGNILKHLKEFSTDAILDTKDKALDVLDSGAGVGGKIKNSAVETVETGKIIAEDFVDYLRAGELFAKEPTVHAPLKDTNEAPTVL